MGRRKGDGKGKPGGTTGKGFVKGQSGNPKGPTPFPADLRQAAKELTQDALDTLTKCLKNRSGVVKVRAAEIILNRGWGCAPQQLEVGVSSTLGEPRPPVELEPPPVDVTESEARAIVTNRFEGVNR